jgi:hypothetical protein
VVCLVACTTTSQTGNGPVDRCPTTDCFNQQQVRDFEVIDSSTLVLYVGNQDCPFLVEFTGSFCDLTFLAGTSLTFRPDSLREEFGANSRLTRICARDMNIGIDEGPFSTSAAGEDLPSASLSCHIRDVASLTDDELLELYVDQRLTPPPPPIGTGRIAVPEEGPADAESQEEGSGSASPP